MKKGWWGFWGYVLGSAETERAARDAYEQGYRDGRYDERCSYTENEEYIEDEDEELAETPSPVEKWVETIELFYRLAVEEKKATGRSDPWLPYRSLIPPQARSLYGYDKFKEGIEDDCLLTEDQERRLLKLLNKRRKAIIESVKRRTMDTDSKRNIIEEHGTLLKKMLGDNNLKMSDKLQSLFNRRSNVGTGQTNRQLYRGGRENKQRE
jgi:hypothetical protein